MPVQPTLSINEGEEIILNVPNLLVSVGLCIGGVVLIIFRTPISANVRKQQRGLGPIGEPAARNSTPVLYGLMGVAVVVISIAIFFTSAVRY